MSSKRIVKLTEGFLKKFERDSPSIQEDVAKIIKDIELDDIHLKRSNIPANAEFKIDKSEERTVMGMSSTRFVDRHNEIVVPKGVNLDQYRKAPVKLWNHDHNRVVGKNVAIKSVNDGILAKTQLADTDDAINTFKLISFGAVNTNSIGFIPTQVFRNSAPGFGTEVDRLKKLWPDFTTKIADSVSSIISKAVLLEDSFAPVPANIDSTLMAVSEKNMGYAIKSLEDLGIKVEVLDDIDEIEDELVSYYKSLTVEKDPERENAESKEKDEKNVEMPPKESNTKEKSDVDYLGTIKLVSRAKLADPRLTALKSMTQDDLIAWQVRKRLGAIR